jgi:predicted permease
MKQSLAVFAAPVPIFALILLGYALRRYRIVPDEFWVPAEKLTYYIFFPLLLLDNLSKANLGDCVSFQWRWPWVRPNTFVGLAAASALFGV